VNTILCLASTELINQLGGLTRLFLRRILCKSLRALAHRRDFSSRPDSRPQSATASRNVSPDAPPAKHRILSKVIMKSFILHQSSILHHRYTLIKSLLALSALVMVSCASAPVPIEKLAVAAAAVERANTASTHESSSCGTADSD